MVVEELDMAVVCSVFVRFVAYLGDELDLVRGGQALLRLEPVVSVAQLEAAGVPGDKMAVSVGWDVGRMVLVGG